MSEYLNRTDYEPHMTEKFQVHIEGFGPMEVELAEIRDRSTDSMDQFSLHFRGPKDLMFHQGIYRLTHAAMGEFTLFLVPVALGRTDGIYYQAVFTRFRESRDDNDLPGTP